MERYSRDLLAWAIEDTMTEPLVLGVLRRAIREHLPKAGLVHHTDRGGQYAGTRYRAVLRRAGMKQSMSRPDNCYDNAFMESCWGTLKEGTHPPRGVSDPGRGAGQHLRVHRGVLQPQAEAFASRLPRTGRV
jgi:transposase InsO family protein